jgi:hypothetical protein
MGAHSVGFFCKNGIHLGNGVEIRRRPAVGYTMSQKGSAF